MKDKNNVERCGTILNKSAVGNEYLWGLRFYILLIECFRQWAAFTEDPDLIQKYNRLKETVPIFEDDVYYFQALESDGLDHHKVDELLGNYSEGAKSPSGHKGNVQTATYTNLNGPPEFIELNNYKNKYLQTVFSKEPDISLICEEHFMYQSYYESLRNKIKSLAKEPGQKKDIEFAESICKLSMNDGIETPKGLSIFRGKVADALKISYGEIPNEYQKLIGTHVKNINPSPVKTDVPEFTTTNFKDKITEQVYEKPSNPKDLRRLNTVSDNPRLGLVGLQTFGKNQNLFKEEEENPKVAVEINQSLKEKKIMLQKEVEKLRNKEKQLRESTLGKSDLRDLQKIEGTPEVLIDEINRKNRAFENLQSKYSSLLNQMNLKMQSNLEKSYINSNLTYSRIEPDFSYAGLRLYDRGSYLNRNYTPTDRSYFGSSRY